MDRRFYQDTFNEKDFGQYLSIVRRIGQTGVKDKGWKGKDKGQAILIRIRYN